MLFIKNIKKYNILYIKYQKISYQVYVNLYKRPSDNSRIFYDTADRTVKTATTSGFYTSRIYIDANNTYEPAMRCTNTTMKLNYLRVLYN